MRAEGQRARVLAARRFVVLRNVPELRAPNASVPGLCSTGIHTFRSPCPPVCTNCLPVSIQRSAVLFTLLRVMWSASFSCSHESHNHRPLLTTPCASNRPTRSVYHSIVSHPTHHRQASLVSHLKLSRLVKPIPALPSSALPPSVRPFPKPSLHSLFIACTCYLSHFVRRAKLVRRYLPRGPPNTVSPPAAMHAHMRPRNAAKA